jgi:hypothetical protein
MGCCIPSKPRKSFIKPIIDKSRISSDLTKKNSLPTSRGTIHLIYNSEFKEKLCLKLKIFEEFQDLFPSSLSESCENNPSLTSYKKNIKFIKKSWNLFKTSFSFFSETTHGCCIENYSIIDGIFILLVSVLASGVNFDSEVVLLSEPPFLIVNVKTNNDTSLILKSWESLSSVFQAFHLKKMQKLKKVILKFQSLLESYENFQPDEGEEKDFKKSEKNIRKLILCAEGLRSDVENDMNEILEFVKCFEGRKEEIWRFAQEAALNFCFSGEYIVHLVLNK